MLMPKRVKYRKQQRGRMRGKALRGAEISFGDYGLMALEPGWVTARQIEAARRTLAREMKRRGKVWIRIFPDNPNINNNNHNSCNPCCSPEINSLSTTRCNNTINDTIY